jgi:hypothetical protein
LRAFSAFSTSHLFPPVMLTFMLGNYIT